MLCNKGKRNRRGKEALRNKRVFSALGNFASINESCFPLCHTTYAACGACVWLIFKRFPKPLTLAVADSSCAWLHSLLPFLRAVTERAMVANSGAPQGVNPCAA